MSSPHSKSPSFYSIFWAFLRLGLTAFGGPAMIPYIREMAVERKKWLRDADVKTGMALSQCIPGATAMQVAAWVGLRAGGGAGALAAYLGFGLPAFCLITVLSFIYVRYHDVSALLAAFQGLNVVVVALVAKASVQFSKQYLKSATDKWLALAAALWLGFKLNPIAALAGACLLSTLLYRSIQAPPAEKIAPRSADLALRSLIGWVTGVFLLLLAALGWLYFQDRELFDLALLMGKVDLFAFGGGYVSVPLLMHEVVEVRNWMSLGELMDGIALGQVTPGPIVMTAAFVGYVLRGLPGAAIATVYVFAPSFLLVTGLAPMVQRLVSQPVFHRALRGSLVTLVGLMAAVTARFALAAPWSPGAGVVCAAALLALWLGADVLWVVGVGAGISMLVL